MYFQIICCFISNCFCYNKLTQHGEICEKRSRRDLLGETTNITSFDRRFCPLTVKDPGKSVFSFVYGRTDLDIATLPETTTLHKALKKHFLQGKEIYNFGGFFFSP